MINLKSPLFMHNQIEFNHTLGNMLRFVISGIIANIVSNFLNVYLISKWKILMKGKHFWLRSVASTALSELMLNIITGTLAFAGTLTLGHVGNIILSGYLLEIFYAFIFVWPGWVLILYLKKKEHIDVYDYNTNYNPFRY